MRRHIKAFMIAQDMIKVGNEKMEWQTQLQILGLLKRAHYTQQYLRYPCLVVYVQNHAAFSPIILCCCLFGSDVFEFLGRV